jgi:hypothetical protein
MPKRKPNDEQFDKDADLLRVIEKYGEAFEDGLAALEYGQGVEAFERASHVLGDGDQNKIDRLFRKWLEPFINQDIGARQRASGHKGKGVRRDTYKRKPIPSPETLLADVERMHADKRYRLQSFNWVCNEVAKAHGYKSAWSVKEACKERPDIKWPDPLRKAK